MTRWDEQTDLLVFGAGAGGMTAALVGKLEGLDVLLCEKTEAAGGITASSAGSAWIPGTSQSRLAGVPDTVEQGRAYLDSVIGTRGGDAAREVFLRTGPAVIDDLEARSAVKFAAATAHPDYLGNHPGAAFGGRALVPLAFDGRLLGPDFKRVLPPWREFMVLGGMMVTRADIPALLAPLQSLANLRRVAALLGRHALDRLRHRRGTNLVMGNALVGRLLYSLREAGVPIRFGTRLVELVGDAGRIAGAVVDGPGGRRTIRAERGVVLATGGLARDPALRATLFPEAARSLSLAPESHTGDAVNAALAQGGMLDDAMESPGLWMPCSVLMRQDGTQSVWPHIILDRAKPGLIAVNAAGRRFCNEADSYHDVCMAMLRADAVSPAIPAHLIVDRRFIADYGLGLVHPGTRNLSRFIRTGYLIEAPDLRTLAVRIGADPDGLEATVTAHNAAARTGVDHAFGRGESDLNRINGDPANKPNPCLRPIGPGPFYAVAVRPADLASSAGLAGDGDGRVLDAAGTPIPGLYACGNDLASIFRGTYPGPGTTIGPALVFGWRAARHAAGLADDPVPARQEEHA
ncbi:FAD-binding protein [Acidisphaera sp. L21]|uniref:FAD-binding protein n=1 Tax=Acidisphaera sp. L21 TaxID=1641851 RepID=UPI00131BED9D|nr:FAD-binding protein [Acidisphaera sp. L21]